MQHLAQAVFGRHKGRARVREGGGGNTPESAPSHALHASCECGRACDPGRISLPRSISDLVREPTRTGVDGLDGVAVAAHCHLGAKMRSLAPFQSGGIEARQKSGHGPWLSGSSVVRPLAWGHPGALSRAAENSCRSGPGMGGGTQRVGGMDPRSRAGRSHTSCGYDVRGSRCRYCMPVRYSTCQPLPFWTAATGTRRGVACLPSLPGSNPIPTVSDRPVLR